MSARTRVAVGATLLVAASIALAIGYARWSYNSLLHEAKLLENDGVALDWNESWLNWFRPVAVNEATITITELPDSRAKIGETVYTFDEGNAHYESIAERLQRLGVEEVRVVKNGEIFFVGTKIGK